MDREEAILLLKLMLFHSVEKEKWTRCCRFHCIHNTGWNCGDDKYKCRLGKDVNECDAGRKKYEPKKIRSKANGSALVYCDECKFDDRSGKCQHWNHITSSQPYTYPNGSLCWSFKLKENLKSDL